MNDKIKEKTFLTINEASLYSGLDKQTIRKMVDQSQIDGYKTPSGQRRINRESLQKLCFTNHNDEIQSACQKQNFLYTRVSTKKQMDDLSRQVEFVRRPEYFNYTLISDIGSGINFKRKGLQTILDACIQRNIGEIIVAHRDRLCRFSFELIETIVKKAGGSIKVLDCDEHTSSEDELSQDLLSIIHIFNCRQMGKRSYKIKNEQKQSVKNTDNTNVSNIMSETNS
jgi:excisionase family DNA binding protein